MESTLLLLALLAASDSPEALFKSAIEDFEFGEHASAAEKLRKVLEPPQLQNREDVIVARQYLGACYHLLDDKVKAKAQFSMLLALDPKHKLDPEVFSPALVDFFEGVRSEVGLSLETPREEQKPPLEERPNAPPTKIETPKPESSPPPAALALIPFGVGQFSNRHPVRGLAFAAGEVGLFSTAIATFAMFEGLKLPDDRCPAEGACVAPEDRDRASTLQTVYLVTFWSGIAVTALGIVEALISYPGDWEAPATAAHNASSMLSFGPSSVTVRF
jgi:hypothetical protein